MYAKYVQMSSQQYLEQLSKGGPQALNNMNMMGGMPPFMMNGYPQMTNNQYPMQFQQMPP